MSKTRGNVVLVDRYRGELKGQLRHGRGVYLYENKYFKYDGEWHDGIKHGHGKLMMEDGSYYEGSFIKGEIEGHGYRVFGRTGSTYTGQFHRGEMHGQGLYQSPDGTQYEGGWQENKREGQGQLTYKDGSIYEGEFHNHYRHGEGTILYSNGDQYEGGWIQDMKHGHGCFKYHDGSIYEGQWKDDCYHGEGTLIHASGIIYQGMWFNGRPEEESVAIISERRRKSNLVVEQSKTFSIVLNCINESGELVTADSGRKFKISALIDKSCVKKSTSKMSLSIAHLLEENATITTPHGEGITYELLQVPQGNATTTIASSQEDLPTSEPGTPRVSSNTNLLQEESKEEINGPLHALSLSPTAIENTSKTGLTGPSTISMYSFNKKPVEMSPEEQFLLSLSPVSTAKSHNGRIEFNQLFLPPPSPPKLSSLVDKVMLSTSDEDTTKSPKPSVKVSKESRSPTPSPDSMKKKSSNTKIKKSNSKSKQTERLMQAKRDKFCPPGTYILVINEITSPPFLGRHLPEAYIVIQVVSQKIGKESSLERLIRGTKSRQILTPTMS